MSLFSEIVSWFSPATATVEKVEKVVAAVPADVSTGISDVSKVLAALTPISPDFVALEAAWKEKSLQAELAAGLPIVEAILKAISIV
ncbi:MAG: hypothetical protein WDN46_22935 [Methylocella sp.]